MDGIPALVLWDFVMEVFHSAPKAFFGSSHFAQTVCNTVSRSVSLHDVVSCLAKDGLLLKLPEDGGESFVGRVQRRCSGQGSGGHRLRARKSQVQRRWQRGQGTHARRCSGWRAPSKFWVTASQQKPGGWGQHFQVEECQGFIQRWQSSDSDGAGAGSRTQGVGRHSGAVDQIARNDDSIFPRAHAACRHASAARSNIGRSSPVASSSRRDGGGERRVPQETRKIPLSLHPTCPGRQSKVWLCFSIRQGTDLLWPR